MFFPAAKGIDFCLISGIFFNFYCVTAHTNGQATTSISGYPTPNLYGRGDGYVQTDVLKVSNGPSYPYLSNNNQRYSAYPSAPPYSSPSYNSNHYSSSEYRPNPSSFQHQRLNNLYWPFHHRANSFINPSSSVSSQPASSSSSSYHNHFTGYQSNSNISPIASNSAYPYHSSSSSSPSSFAGYGQPNSNYNHPHDPHRNDWYGNVWRYPNYSFYPHTSEYLTSNHANAYYVGNKMVKAIAELRSSSKVTGSVTFEQADEKIVIIKGRILGLPPGPHGFHILENKNFKDCSLGEHFNPTNTAHGGKNDWVRHVGDLGNIFADRDGVAYFDMTDQIISLHDGVNSIINRTVVITEKADDLGRVFDSESKRNGNSGKPMACGTIVLTRF